MTNEEEKILEEILDEGNDITLEKAAEEAEDLQEETQDEVKEVREEIPDDVRLDPDEIRERPVLRGGLRGAADPNMIQKHIDNFLAMLCGETPVDSNVRTSAEYWLKRLATGEGAGSTKKIYQHNIFFQRGGTAETTSNSRIMGVCVIFNNSSDSITQSDFLSLIDQPGTVITVNGLGDEVGASSFAGTSPILYLRKDPSAPVGIVQVGWLKAGENYAAATYNINTTAGWISVIDLGAIPLN